MTEKKENKSVDDTTVVGLKPKPTTSVSLGFLCLLLFMTCCNLFATNLLNQTVRTNISYWVPFLGVKFGDAGAVEDMPTMLQIPNIFLAIFAGAITDWLSVPLTLIIFSCFGVCGLVCFMAFAWAKSSFVFYYIAMIIYGGALNLSRIPMQKMSSVLFQGPYLAFAMNVNHTFSHLSSISANIFAAPLMNGIGIPYTIYFLCVCGFATLPICFILYGLYTLKISVKEGSSKGSSLLDSLKEVLRSDYLIFVVAFMGCFVDGVNVAYKNIESRYLKKGFNFTMETANSVTLIGKVSLLFTPLFSLLVDKLGHRHLWLCGTTAVQMGCYGAYYWFARHGSPAHSLVSIVGIIGRIASSLFYAAFYSFFAISFDKKVRGIGFGFINSWLSIFYIGIPFCLKIIPKEDLNTQLLTLIGMVGFGFLISILIIFLNAAKGNIMNKDKIAQHVAQINKTTEANANEAKNGGLERIDSKK